MRSAIIAACVVVAIIIAAFALRPHGGIPVGPDDPVLGKPDAPVTVVIFTHQQCTYSKQFFAEILPRMNESYIAQGKVRLVYKSFPPPDGAEGAVAALCANEQERFWEYNELARTTNVSKSADGAPIINTSTYLVIARGVGLDEVAFRQCLEENRYAAVVEQTKAQGEELGVRRTPTIFVNGLMIQGTPSWTNMTAVLDQFG